MTESDNHESDVASALIAQLRARVAALENESVETNRRNLLLVRESAAVRQRLLQSEHSVVLLEQRLLSLSSVLKAPKGTRSEDLGRHAQTIMRRSVTDEEWERIEMRRRDS